MAGACVTVWQGGLSFRHAVEPEDPCVPSVDSHVHQGERVTIARTCVTVWQRPVHSGMRLEPESMRAKRGLPASAGSDSGRRMRDSVAHA